MFCANRCAGLPQKYVLPVMFHVVSVYQVRKQERESSATSKVSSIGREFRIFSVAASARDSSKSSSFLNLCEQVLQTPIQKFLSEV